VLALIGRGFFFFALGLLGEVRRMSGWRRKVRPKLKEKLAINCE